MFENLKPISTVGLRRITDATPVTNVGGTKLLDGERVFREKFERRSTVHALHVRNAAKELHRLPYHDEVITLLMAGNFGGFDFVAAILRLAAPATIAELCIATLGFSESNSGELLHLLDTGAIGKVWMLASCYMRDSSGHLYQPLVTALESRGQRINATRNHCKVIAAKLTDGRYVVVDGSMNLRSCKNVEQAHIWGSPGLFNFYADYIREATERTGRVK